MGIDVLDDELIPDEELAHEWGTTCRTLRRYDALPNGLPFWIIAGKKYRGRRASAKWLAGRMRKPNPKRTD